MLLISSLLYAQISGTNKAESQAGSKQPANPSGAHSKGMHSTTNCSGKENSAELHLQGFCCNCGAGRTQAGITAGLSS